MYNVILKTNDSYCKMCNGIMKTLEDMFILHLRNSSLTKKKKNLTQVPLTGFLLVISASLKIINKSIMCVQNIATHPSTRLYTVSN